ncbi:MAG: ubiB [Glaciihabitans sp.]|nr:ubiB [Glaciihabitans sp.]
MPALFDPITLRDVEIRNRLWVAPMCQYTILEWDGVPRDWHFVHLGAMAAGGAGLIVVEASAIVPDGRISPADTGIWNDTQATAWAKITAFLHAQGAKVGIQLAHAGRKASTWPDWGYGGKTGSMSDEEGGWETVAPSELPYPDHRTPRSLSRAEIHDLVESFAAAATRAVRAGFDVIELHGAHGYLIHQFLSPLANSRVDDYGGSVENRARFLLQIVAAVRSAIGENVPLFIRLSATDWVIGGWDEEETATVAGWAKLAGADLIDVSSGGITSGVPIQVGPGYQVPLATRLKSRADVLVSAVGAITTPIQADSIIRADQADAVMIAREFSRDPHFALRAAHELGVELSYWPPQYVRTHWPKEGAKQSAFNDG